MSIRIYSHALCHGIWVILPKVRKISLEGKDFLTVKNLMLEFYEEFFFAKKRFQEYKNRLFFMDDRFSDTHTFSLSSLILKS